MTKRSARFYLAGFLCLLNAAFFITLVFRFWDCKIDLRFEPLSMFATEEQMRHKCAENMWPFTFLFE